MAGCFKTFFIGKGETRDILFKIRDEKGVLLSNDKVLFAMKATTGSQLVVKTDTKKISELVLDGTTYKYLVTLNSAFTESLKLADYVCDLTLINANGDKKTLTQFDNKPVPFVIQIVPTVGASI